MTDNSNLIITNPNSESKIIEGNIYYILFYDDSYSELNDVKLSYEAYTILGKGEKMKVLIEMGNNATFDKESREYGQANKIPAIAEAIILSSLAQRLLYKFYLKFRVLDHPIKIFQSKKNAIDWLNNI
jgi:hypothetical protein